MAQWRLNTRNGAIQQAQTALSGYTVRYPNQKGFTPPNNGTWLAVNTLFPESPFSIAMVGTDKIDFILQVDVMIPKGKGDVEAYTIADTLDNGFPIDGTPITYNGQEIYVKTVGSIRPLPLSGEDDAWERYIIRIGMYAFVDRS